MKRRTAAQEWRAGIWFVVIGVVVLAGMLAMWWLVEATNEEGEHDAQLLPLFALIPLLLGAFHLFRSRVRTRRSLTQH